MRTIPTMLTTAALAMPAYAAALQRHQSSLNPALAVPDADGSYTYAAAVRNPGVANWLDTGGARERQAGLRWRGMPPGSDGAALLLGAQVMTLAQVAALQGPARVSLSDRRAALARRVADHRTRLGD